ncbi:excinuclease ABC subunit UvrC [Shewanella sp. JNE10-2]|uniref:excinuclease ABC subunit UvrC n=1 Tax=unclassified Shewanella TaxID=196818 RepID=UPI002004A0B6|nr:MULTISPECIES: excinuclease ABC subunit UvrC [unclassified Shewanella]MCK7632042.1 excinuclease ABC subunit UvrC [Shewanella sp. JNE9-1]MCK7647352.1 excinuclease ABC subunit UvrC [Shewanella sp. JNE3-1]MCK7655340.1 excinuclease ABC subunit UvrC [Shewanella sp. JNE4-1]UPO25870.1 excinuclease ABC subunit UvrC [Shewanella sp. JNE10-2]UPO36856.1 excinuclease ABC subunit UvrC [Shewanella sp. JNE7]
MSSVFNAQSFLRTVSSSAGVYRMYDVKGDVIYVGKAKDLKKRLSSYFRKNLDNVKTQALVSHIHHIDVTLTHSETDALLLENDYIKQYMPKYNVLLRDDKSYPYILLSQHEHPRLAYHRGPQREKGHYFGPYPNGGAVRESLHLMQKLFPIRQCDDLYYKSRSRPCLQYQLSRCSAPCVGKVSNADYDEQVKLASLFLKGKDQQVISTLVAKMEQAAQQQEYEQAARFRDQIMALRKVAEQQEVSNNKGDMDVIGVHYASGIACFHLLFIREGKIFGSRSYYPSVPAQTDMDEVLRSFILQFYLNADIQRTIPKEVVISHNFEELHELEAAVSIALNKKFLIKTNVRADRASFLRLAVTNATNAVITRLSHKNTVEQRFVLLEEILELSTPIHRMECFDISHTMGESTVASCVVFNREGPHKGEYRRYNIEGITPGDDYAAMKQAITRRFDKIEAGGKIPDILFIDGGLGQLRIAQKIVDEKFVHLDKAPQLIGVAKGEGRKPGLETLILGDTETSFSLEGDSPALHLIQHIRDESHRFAITGHRNRRQKTRNTSTLESIPGIGPKRRKALLQHLGGLQEVKGASVAELVKVPGISIEMAQTIHDALRG